MEQHEIRLVEEENTIYEIDMDCIRKKQLAAKRAMEADEKRKLDFEKKNGVRSMKIENIELGRNKEAKETQNIKDNIDTHHNEE